jgi:hypothetical protein
MQQDGSSNGKTNGQSKEAMEKQGVEQAENKSKGAKPY